MESAKEISSKKNVKTNSISMAREDSLLLISCVQAREVLWNRRHRNYKNRVANEDAWAEISSILAVPVQQLKEKWSVLRSSYRTYHSRVMKSQITGSSSQSIYKPTWFAFDAMSFMAHVSEVADTIDTFPNTSVSAGEAMVEEWLESEMPDENRVASSRPKRKKTAAEYDDEIIKNLNALTEIAERCARQPEDDLELFARNLTYNMRELSPNTIKRLKISFQEQVLEAQKEQL